MRRRQQDASSFEQLKDLLRGLDAHMRKPAASEVDVETKTRFVSAIYRFNRITGATGIDEYDVQQALSDAESLGRLLQHDSKRPAADKLLQTQMERVADKLNEILSTLPQRYTDTLSAGLGGAVTGTASVALNDVANSYGTDADRERRAALGFTILAVLLLIAASAAAYWIVSEATTAEANRVWAAALGPIIICGATALAAILTFRQSANHRRTSREYIRLQRGFLAIPEYLAPLPAEVQHLIRATMTQSLFPRLLEDDDPVRQAVWPESDTMLEAIFGREVEDDEEGKS